MDERDVKAWERLPGIQQVRDLAPSIKVIASVTEEQQSVAEQGAELVGVECVPCTQ
jgi:hypothetical protein